MATQKFAAQEIRGYTPAIEATVTDTIFALSGRNYLFDSRGPISAFGNRFLAPVGFIHPQYIQGQRLHFKDGDLTLTLAVDGIYRWLEDAGGWILLYQTEDTTGLPYRWTTAYLEGYIYLCHPMAGILVFDPKSGTIVPLDRVGVVPPTSPIAIAVNNGRLCVIDPIFFSWSMPADGLDFTPALGGGGFQQISDRVGGVPTMITSYAGATLTWTTGGVMRSEFTGDAAVFRHRSLSTDVRPANSFCVVGIANDTSLILDERGLFSTQGDSPQPLDPVFNQFVRTYIRDNDLKTENRLRIEFDELQRKLYVSMSLAYASQGYDKCFVLDPDLQKWGEFSEFHYGILPIRIDLSRRLGDYFGYCDSDGRIRAWVATPTVERVPGMDAYNDSNLFYPVVEKMPMPIEPYTGIIMPTTIKAYGFDPSILYEGFARAGYYPEGYGSPSLTAVDGLDAAVTFGLFRPTGPGASDEASEVLGVTIRSWPSQPADVFVEDYELEDGSEDFESSPNPDVDYGDGVIPSATSHKLTVHSSLDGVSDFMAVDPVMVQFAQNARYYSCSSVGMWHSIEVSATEPGESFHIVGGELTAASAGRII